MRVRKMKKGKEGERRGEREDKRGREKKKKKKKKKKMMMMMIKPMEIRPESPAKEGDSPPSSFRRFPLFFRAGARQGRCTISQNLETAIYSAGPQTVV
jgi:hypothetical protein